MNKLGGLQQGGIFPKSVCRGFVQNTTICLHPFNS